jgi:hypothetical protein
MLGWWGVGVLGCVGVGVCVCVGGGVGVGGGARHWRAGGLSARQTAAGLRQLGRPGNRLSPPAHASHER